VSSRSSDARANFRLPYAEQLVGNPETGVLHGGAISAAMDAACGPPCSRRCRGRWSIATLDLRIDYLKLATPRRDVVIHAHCYKVTRSVAFVRGVAFHDDEADPIASGTGSFMLGTAPGATPRGE
jgi:acyl-coenzyme A thioesterase PaaI-like protein